jgi:hypothetical protein
VELREHGSTAGGDADNGGDPAGRADDKTPQPAPEAAPEPTPEVDAAVGAPVDSPLEAPVDDVPSESAEPTGRRYPSTIGGAIFLGVLGMASFGLAIVTDGNWRLGVKWIAASLLAAAVARMLLPAPQAGMLAVRRRALDVVLLVAVGLMLWFLSATIPNSPPPL